MVTSSETYSGESRSRSPCSEADESVQSEQPETETVPLIHERSSTSDGGASATETCKPRNEMAGRSFSLNDKAVNTSPARKAARRRSSARYSDWKAVRATVGSNMLNAGECLVVTV